MTCIVGIETPDGVWIGGDSAALSGWVHTSSHEPKVFTNGDYLLGFTTSFRMGQLLRFADLPKPLDRQGDELVRFLTTEFVDAVRTLFKDGGFAQKDSEQEKAGTFLLSVNGCLFTVDSNYMVGRNREGYDACGSGWEIALGALHATRRVAPERRVRTALEAAAAHCGSVRGPFTVERQPWTGVQREQDAADAGHS